MSMDNLIVYESKREARRAKNVGETVIKVNGGLLPAHCLRAVYAREGGNHLSVRSLSFNEMPFYRIWKKVSA